MFALESDVVQASCRVEVLVNLGSNGKEIGNMGIDAVRMYLIMSAINLDQRLMNYSTDFGSEASVIL